MDEVYKKLETIRDVWNYNIWDYPYCQSEIKFNSEAKTNYFGDLIGYFHDTLEILKSPIQGEGFSGVFSYHLSLLQILYVQQDFIEELLKLFSTGYDKGDLKKDENYYINREIRNELIGHPIRRDKVKKLVSSTLFSYESKLNNIEYLRYHQDNNFQFESIKHKVSEVLERHITFLNRWLDIIIEKLKLVVSKHKIELNKILDKISTIKFESLVSLLEQKYKPFLKNTYLYDKDSILKIFQKRKLHIRYNIVYEKFMEDLKMSLIEEIQNCDEVFTRQFKIYDGPVFEVKPIIFYDEDENIDVAQKRSRNAKKDYHYPLQKLIDSNRRNYDDFDFFSSLILSQTKNRVVANELNRMRENLFDEIEYISSYRLICSILKN